MTDKGTYIQYVPRKFGTEAMEWLRNANTIIHEYESQGMAITIRQLHYQFVSRDLYANTQKNYDKLGGIISDGRLAGLVSWTAIEDRGRGLRGLDFSTSPSAAIQHARDAYRIDKWSDQPMRPEVWVEKDALLGVVGSACEALFVDYFSCRGYNSQSEQWRAGRRFADRVRRGQRPIVFHLGDHDPSGIDMTRDNRERLSMFAGVDVQVVRLALNMDQVEQYDPPPNPLKRVGGKLSDSRAGEYQDEHGDSSWELDALDPVVIRDLITDAVTRVRDERLWSARLAQEAADKDMFDQIIEEI